jgi:branched-chain amino acid transport system permease protein/neutral amino acid transport system permease protein
LEQVGQLIANGVVAGSLIALPAMGFTMIFAVLRFANFALAAHLAIGAYAGYLANTVLGAPIAVALVAGFGCAGAVGAICQQLVLRPFALAGSLTVAVASIALNLVLENVIRLIFGNDVRAFDLPIYRDIHLGALRIGPQQIENLLLASVVMALAFVFLKATRAGRAMRAVADDPVLADIKGINPHFVAAVTTFVGMGLAGAGGVLVGLDTTVDPLIGFRLILSVFAAAVLGGLGSIPGAVAGALVIGVAEELSLLVLAPTYRSAVGFVAILVVLTLRPAGLLAAARGS